MELLLLTLFDGVRANSFADAVAIARAARVGGADIVVTSGCVFVCSVSAFGVVCVLVMF